MGKGKELCRQTFLFVNRWMFVHIHFHYPNKLFYTVFSQMSSLILTRNMQANVRLLYWIYFQIKHIIIIVVVTGVVSVLEISQTHLWNQTTFIDIYWHINYWCWVFCDHFTVCYMLYVDLDVCWHCIHISIQLTNTNTIFITPWYKTFQWRNYSQLIIITCASP